MLAQKKQPESTQANRVFIYPGKVVDYESGNVVDVSSSQIAAACGVDLDKCFVVTRENVSAFVGMQPEPGDVHVEASGAGRYPKLSL